MGQGQEILQPVVLNFVTKPASDSRSFENGPRSAANNAKHFHSSRSVERSGTATVFVTQLHFGYKSSLPAPAWLFCASNLPGRYDHPVAIHQGVGVEWDVGLNMDLGFHS